MATSTDDIRKTRILIIGAGISGIAAANELVKKGIKDFLILEGRNRIGGRIIGIPLENHKVELGANWIHGILGNPMYELAIRNNLIDIVQNPKPHKIVATTEQGRRIPFHILQEVHEAYFWFFKRCEEYFLGNYDPPEGIHSVEEHLNLEIDIYLRKYNESERVLRRLVFDYLFKRETCISGCHSMTEVSVAEIGSYTELPGGNLTLPDGYSSILKPLMRDLPQENILKNHAVEKIIWRNSSHKVEVLCTNGKRFEANQVVCTLPLGVLKEKGKSLFQPPLCENRLGAIERLHFGTVDKIFLEYERPFLHPEISEVIFLWEPSKENDLSRNWFKKIYSFAKVSETLLLGWVSGREAEYMETLPNDVVKSKCTEILRTFLNDPTVPEPKTCVTTSWYKQPYTRGSYTCVGVRGSRKDIEFLATPMYCTPSDSQPVIVWAGEHTHPSYYSTAHGAYLSGQRAASELFGPTSASS